MTQVDAASLGILHVLRAPLGGLFRHVVDLTREQIARGHRVGLIADSITGGEPAERALAELAPHLALGLSRTAMRRSLHPSDALALAHVNGRIRETQPDIVHGHGSKGGAFARMAGFGPGQIRGKVAYTPHGGSFNYRPGGLAHAFYMSAERLLAARTHVFLFESAYIRRRFHERVSRRAYRERVVLNGISAAEFVPVTPAPDAADFLYVGELRSAKGIDTLLDALAQTARRGWPAPTAVLVGSGPDEAQLMERTQALGLQSRVRFPGRMPARDAFSLGRIMIVPSRAESLPYVVLEAIGARLPLISTNVGGIPEIFGPYSEDLIPCNDVPRLAAAMLEALASSPRDLKARAEALADHIASQFTIAKMVDAVMAGYHDALSDLRDGRVLPAGPARVST